MRLIEIADPQDYIPTVAEAEGFLKQLLRVWSDRSADGRGSTLLPKQPLIIRRKLFDAL
jgi:hypothetical protein